MPSLTGWYIENASASGKSEQLDEARRFLPISLEGEKGTVLEQIVGVEGRLPPFFRFPQKNTGSRYAPNTLSIAARISYSVQ